MASHVGHQDPGGTRRIMVFDRGYARLVAHEVDHHNGILCTAECLPSENPFPSANAANVGSSGRTRTAILGRRLDDT